MKKEILLIEDNEDHVVLIKRILDEAKYNITVLTDGKAALDYLLHPVVVPDVILLDYYIPSVNGFYILRQVKKAGKVYSFIVMTVDNTIETVIESMRCGAMDYIPKKEGFYYLLPDMIERVYLLQKSKQKEQQLLQLQGLWKSVVMNAPNVIMTVDVNGFIQFINHSAIYEKSEEAIGKNIYDFVLPEFHKIVKEKIKKVFDTGTTDFYEIKGKRKNNTIGWYSTNVSPVIIQDKIVSVALFVTDITAKKRIEEKEKEYQNNLRLLNDFIFNLNEISSEHDIYRYLADKLYELTGAYIFITDFNVQTNISKVVATAGTGEILNRILSILRMNPLGMSFKNDRNIFNRFLTEKLFLFEGNLFELTLGVLPEIICHQLEKIIPDRKIYQIGFIRNNKILGSTTFFIQNEISGTKKEFIETVVSQFSIILSKRLTEKELFIEKNRAEESDRLKTSFLANLSHEIRTPMNAIIGFSDLLSTPGITEQENKEFIQNIQSSGSMLLKLIEDIIDIAKIESGQVKINISECYINSLLYDIFMSFKDLGKYKRKEHLELRLNRANESFDFVIQTDQIRIKQILNNLIDNAMKYTDKGTIEFGYTLHNKDTILFFVKDTGRGIQQDKLNCIFERFRQSDDTDERIFGGTGLGLAISKNLVELMDGKIWVESTYGKGSTFYFTIPNLLSEKDEIQKTSDASVLIDYSDWRDKLFLIAEDDDTNYDFLYRVLKKYNVRIIRAVSGKEAVELCREHPVDIVLMDIKMPVMDGLQATRLIKQYKADIPVIAQTAYAMQDEKEKCRAAGCDDYLPKPILIKDLLSVIKRHLK